MKKRKTSWCLVTMWILCRCLWFHDICWATYANINCNPNPNPYRNPNPNHTPCTKNSVRIHTSFCGKCYLLEQLSTKQMSRYQCANIDVVHSCHCVILLCIKLFKIVTCDPSSFALFYYHLPPITSHPCIPFILV